MPLAPDSWLGERLQEKHGFLAWVIALVVVFGVLERWLARAGVTMQRRATPPAPPEPARAPGLPWAPAVAPPGAPRRWLGPWKIATIGGIQFSIDASLPLGGLFVATYLGTDGRVAVASNLAFLALIAAHEAGHVVAARALGLKVFAVRISGLGGRCLTQLPRGVKDTWALFSGGLAAQAVLLLLTVAVVAITGVPTSAAGQAVVTTLTVVNGVVLAVNLVPGTISENLSTDGGVLWDLFLHVFHGRAHPLARLHAASPILPAGTRLTNIEGMVPPGFVAGVQILNDDRTPADVVVAMLETHLRFDHDAAVAAMLRIHTTGGLLVSTANAQEAGEIAERIRSDTRARGHLLACQSVTTPDADEPSGTPA